MGNQFVDEYENSDKIDKVDCPSLNSAGPKDRRMGCSMAVGAEVYILKRDCAMKSRTIGKLL